MSGEISRRTALAMLGGSLAASYVPAAAAAGTEKLRVGKAVAQVFGYIPLDIGMKFGIFAKHGLEIEETAFVSGSQLAQAITADAIDITLSGGPDMAFTAKGAPEIAVASIATSPVFMGIAVGAQSTAKSSNDLKGKKIAVTSPGSLTYWLVDELNRVKGWTGDDRVQPIATGGAPPTMLAAIRTGQVDGAVGGLQVGFQLEEQKEGRLLIDLSDYVKEIELFVAFAHTTLVKQNPDAVRRFLVGWFESVAYMKAHKAESVQLASGVLNWSHDVTERCYDRTIGHFSTNGKFEKPALDKLQASFVDLKVLDGTVDISKLYTEEFLPKA
jgi:ABC-type nitrate/sulfonate/bicarbonate transport system substrate-binding protein